MADLVSRAAGRTDTGRVREINEDRVLVVEDVGRGCALYGVADGLGGHAGGDVASALAMQTLGAGVRAALAEGRSAREALVGAVRRANDAIRASGAGPAGMATTCTAVLVRGAEAVIAHVGDSRAYLLRGSGISPLTTDHSLAGELARRGAVSEDAVESHAQRHVLTRALGAAPDVEIDVTEAPLRLGDILVLTTDGLHNAVPAPELAAVVRAARTLDEACGDLIGLANARGGVDNASALLIRIAARWPGPPLRAVAPLALAAFIAAGVGIYRLEHVYFLGVHAGRVAVMRGVPGRVLGLRLSGVIRVTQVPLARVAPAYRSRLSTTGIPTASPEAAERLLLGLLSPER
jgi:serine/threonine protein phosphatase PrpC